MDTSDMRKLMDAHPELREKLFARGFLLTDDSVDADAYPFFGLWSKTAVGGATLLIP